MAYPFEKALESVDVVEVKGSLRFEASGISQHSQRIRPGYVFAAREGGSRNALDFLPEAVKAGAVALVTDQLIPPDSPIPAVRVRDFRHALTILSHRLFGDPSRRLKLIGVTGTDGKTSSVHIIRSIIRATGQKCGMISTLGYDVGSQWYSADLTTPDIDHLCFLLDEMRGCGWAASEISSHALSQGRVEGLRFAAAGYTQLSREHQDFHPSMEHYALTKSLLLAMLESDGVGVVNAGDPWSRVMVEACRGRVITYGRPGVKADLIVTTLEQSLKGGVFRLDYEGQQYEVETPLIGVYQGENIALAAGIALGNGFAPEAVVSGVAVLNLVPGRMERVDCGQPFEILVDYSHTGRSLWNALNTLRPLAAGRLTVVFGCGGNRDRLKRPEMGRIAAENADLVYVTSDNPRDEDPEAIINEIFTGIESGGQSVVHRIPDRREAIFAAVRNARIGDVLLLAGKGAETTQTIAGEKYDFDDRTVAREALKIRGWWI